MFLRIKRTQGYAYVQLVENRWQEGRSRQRVLATLGRLDQLQESGSLAALLESGSRLVEGPDRQRPPAWCQRFRARSQLAQFAGVSGGRC